MSSVLNIVVALMDFHSGSDITVHKNVQRERFQTICAKLTCAAAQQNNTKKKKQPIQTGWIQTHKEREDRRRRCPTESRRGLCSSVSSLQYTTMSLQPLGDAELQSPTVAPYPTRTPLHTAAAPWVWEVLFFFLFLLSFFLSLFLLSSFFYVPLS